jgi:hypothetical protein
MKAVVVAGKTLGQPDLKRRTVDVSGAWSQRDMLRGRETGATEGVDNRLFARDLRLRKEGRSGQRYRDPHNWSSR